MQLDVLPGNAILCVNGSCRTIYVPGSDLSSAPQKVVELARRMWTPDVVATHLNIPVESVNGADPNPA